MISLFHVFTCCSWATNSLREILWLLYLKIEKKGYLKQVVFSIMHRIYDKFHFTQASKLFFNLSILLQGHHKHNQNLPFQCITSFTSPNFHLMLILFYQLLHSGESTLAISFGQYSIMEYYNFGKVYWAFFLKQMLLQYGLFLYILMLENFIKTQLQLKD